MNNVIDSLAQFVGRQSSWSRWIGGITLLAIVFTWSYVCITTGSFVQLDLSTVTLIVGLFLVTGTKGQQPPPSEPKNDL